MPLSYYPRVGEILACDYGTKIIPPEMNKTRPVVVIGPRLRRRGELVGVIPLSTTEPKSMEAFHCRFVLDKLLPPPFESPVVWAKCDMYSTVALGRLDRFKEPRASHGGARKWRSGRLNAEQIRQAKIGLLCGLGFDSLTGNI